MTTGKCDKDVDSKIIKTGLKQSGIPHSNIHKIVEDIECKLCSKCKVYRPLCNYNKSSFTWDKLRYECKQCIQKYSKTKIYKRINCPKCDKELHQNSLKDHFNTCGNKKKPSSKRIPHKTTDNIECKRCFNCKEYKPLNLYNNSKTTWDKLRRDCKDCVKIYRNSIKNKFVKCDICDKNIKYTYLFEHKQNKHSENIYNWTCEVCVLTFKHEKLYKRHLLTNSHIHKYKANNISENDLTEDILKKVSELSEKDVRYIKNNIITKNSKNDKETCKGKDKSDVTSSRICKCKCEYCNKEFSRPDILKRHIKTIHETPEKVTCNLCNKSMTKRSYEENHIGLCITNKLIKKYPGCSKWERFTSKFLINNEIKFECQKKFKDLKKKSLLAYDFYLPDHNILIEVNGKQHYYLTNYKNAQKIFDENQNSDKLKKEYAQINNYNLIIIDTRKYKDYDKISKYLSEHIQTL
uniref:C2H2-type domain-containing protein n=1 Tax=viral metagenome TaxID=1070528 RepID=A0A6C0CIS0_9ZZZZ